MSADLRQDQFLNLLDEHRRILFKIARSYCRNAADREDLIQEMIVQLWRSFASYDPRRRFTTWMYRVALNVAISHMRSESRRPRETVPLEGPILEVAATPPESAALEDDLRQLQQRIGELDPLDRALMILYLDGNPHDAIADVLGISPSNVGTKIGRIKQRLRRAFDRTNEERKD